MSKKKPLLEGHKRKGKRWVPPMMQLSFNTSVSYINDMLPELVWIGLLNDRVGYARAARILEKVFLIANEVKGPNLQGNFALLSTFSLLNDEQKSSLKGKLEKEGILELLQNCIAPLTLLYDQCPLLFLGPPTSVFNKDQLVSSITESVRKAIDKYNTPGIVLNGAMLLWRLVTGTIHFSSKIDLPNLNAVIDSPDSEEAKRAAGLIRANALGEFGMLNIGSSWARNFWNHGIALSPCEFSDQENLNEQS